MVVKRYLAEHGLEGRAIVTEVGGDERGPWVRLSETWFHPQGGGQKADRGTIEGLPVLHVAHTEGGEVNHYIEVGEGLAVGQAVSLCIDPVWRQINARHHTGGHLVACVVEQQFPELNAVSGHHWPGEARVEFEVLTGGLPDPDKVGSRLTAALAATVSADLPVTIVGDPFEARAIQVGTHRPVPCGGTHLDRVGSLTTLTVTGIKVKSGKLRVSYSL